jgi:single-stranded-DNA-specific exonuclease
VIWFRGADVELPDGAIDFAYSLSINEYRGERSLQLGYVASRPAEVDRIDVVEIKPKRIPIHDLREELVQPADLLTPDFAFWLAEGPSLGNLSEQFNRDFREFYRTKAVDAPKSRPLVVWSIPPSGESLSWLVETLSPSEIYLIGQVTSDDSLEAVVKYVAGMAKYALSRDCRLTIDQLAARIDTTEAVIRHSLLWLEMKNLIQLVEWESGDVVRIAAGNGNRPDETERQILEAELKEQLAEVSAYRRFFKRAKVAELRLDG